MRPRGSDEDEVAAASMDSEDTLGGICSKGLPLRSTDGRIVNAEAESTRIRAGASAARSAGRWCTIVDVGCNGLKETDFGCREKESSGRLDDKWVRIGYPVIMTSL